MDNEENLVGGTVAEPLPTASVKVLSFVNLALMQNGLPVMQDLRIANRSDSSLKDVVCAFSSEDGLIVPGQLALGEIGPGETAATPSATSSATPTSPPTASATLAPSSRGGGLMEQQPGFHPEPR